MMRFFLLLLMPVIVSLAPPRKIPDRLRYENVHGDVVQVAQWRRGDPSIFLELLMKRTGCTQQLFGMADKRCGNRYSMKMSGVEMVLHVSERKVRIIRISSSLIENEACSGFAGVYTRVEIE